MQVDLIPIGNSRGIRIPKAVLDQCRFGDRADLSVTGGRLVVSATSERRYGWEEAFRKMVERKDDDSLVTPTSSFDEEDWWW